ncbi:MAG: ribonuclease HIII [Puniceicoccales bacterium]|jgi:ribonuclease HIII|nr:ribonuclease HIII [Puniceicoccales bacterium]
MSELNQLKDQKTRPVASTYSIKLDSEQMRTLYDLCLGKGFEKYDVAYAKFAFRGNQVNIVAYDSGKLVVQGKKMQEFVQFELEMNVTCAVSFGYEEVMHPEWLENHAGMDESGKGDLFGPLVTACVIAGGDVVRQWLKDGIRDSKTVSNDRMIFSLESKILKSDCVAEIMCLSMEKYNELYIKFGKNMNVLLGWMHSCSLENALQKRRVPWGMLDQFSKRPIVQSFLSSELGDEIFDLRMRTKAESDPVVAAASILARAEYNRRMDALSKLAGFRINKGAGRITVEQANKIVAKFGYGKLSSFVKTHFAIAPKA